MGGYLTVVDLTFDTPSIQIPGDLVIVDNGDDEPLLPAYEVHRSLNIAGIPAGVFVILGVVAGVIVLVALGTHRSRASSAGRSPGSSPRRSRWPTNGVGAHSACVT